MQLKVQPYSYNYNNKNYNHNQIANIQYCNARMNNTPSFTGLKILNINKFKKMFMASESMISEVSDRAETILGIQSTRVKNTLTQSYASESRVKFLYELTEYYNGRNCSLGEKLREDPQEVINIYNLVTKPTKHHENVLGSSNLPVKTLKEIFTHAKTEKSLDFVHYTQNNILDSSNVSAQIIIKMLKSKYNKEFIENTNDYKSYLILHKKDSKCIEKLEKLIESGEYKPETFNLELMYENLKSTHDYQQTLAPYDKFIHERINKPRVGFLSYFFEHFLGFRNNLTKDDKSDIVKMYLSATEENLNLRKQIMIRFRDSYAQEKTHVSDIRSMSNLFETIDKDKYAFSFVDKALKDDIAIDNMEELRRILDIVPSKKAAIFHQNIVKIINCTTPAERETALAEEIENPFFPQKIAGKGQYGINEGEMHSQQESFFNRIALAIKNEFNIRRYNIMTEKVKPQSSIQEGVEASQTQQLITHKTATSRTVSNNTSATDNTALIPPENTAGRQSPAIVRRTLKSAPSAKKLQAQADVTNYIKTKLGYKTFENQQRDYAIKATLMRLRLLPEIFDSISATRAAQRAKGIRPNVENKDAFMLYQMIQGRNRKLVRYMLKQTDSENQRIFSIKDIIRLVENADSAIAKNKRTNPDYRAKDARAYYEELYQNLINQYGNLKRGRKK